MKPSIAAEPLPEIPRKRYFAIGEVSDLCGVKPHVLRYWEQEFPQLRPVKRRGNRRYYQLDDVLMVRRIRGLLYEQGFTIGGARLRLRDGGRSVEEIGEVINIPAAPPAPTLAPPSAESKRQGELRRIRDELENLLNRWPV